MRVWRMRTGISITLKPADRRRLKALARDRNAPHKHVWRAEIVLFSGRTFVDLAREHDIDAVARQHEAADAFHVVNADGHRLHARLHERRKSRTPVSYTHLTLPTIL